MKNQQLPQQYKPTDADVINIHAAGLRLVHKPDSKVVSLADHIEAKRVMQSYTSPEVA
jgi:hypothetical protein